MQDFMTSKGKVLKESFSTNEMSVVRQNGKTIATFHITVELTDFGELKDVKKFALANFQKIQNIVKCFCDYKSKSKQLVPTGVRPDHPVLEQLLKKIGYI
jgi:hypothetical protein